VDDRAVPAPPPIGSAAVPRRDTPAYRGGMGGDEDGEPVPPCGADDVVVTVVWERRGTGLRGRVVVENVGGRVCRLGGKPTVRPLAGDGRELGVQTVVTLEWRSPGYTDLAPGRRAAARVSWDSWCGQVPSGRALVEWHDGSAVARVRGPLRPPCDQTRHGNLSSSWFDLTE
jgi:Protein of unknown function (DUF4232)